MALDGTELWRWCPPDARVIGILELPGDTDVIVLTELKSALPKGQASLFRCRLDGRILWTGEVPPGGDGTYTFAEITKDGLEANTWDGRRVIVDIDTGRIRRVNVAFVK